MAVTFTAQGGKNVESGKELEVQSVSVTGGTVYVSTVRQAGGSVTGVASSFVPSAAAAARRVNMANAYNTDGTVLTASASAGKFGKAWTFGTSESLVTEAANSNTKTDAVVFEHIVPDSYAAASNPSIIGNWSITIGSGTLSVKTLAFDVRKVADDGTQGSNLVTTAATASTSNSATDYTFAMNGATLNPGDRLQIKATIVLTETGASNVTANLNSVRFTGM